MREATSPMAYTVPGTCSTLNVGTSTVYELIRLGVLDARKAGRRTLITADSIRSYLDNLPRAELCAPRNRKAPQKIAA